MNINFIYDASVSSAPAGFKTALNTVAQEASQIFADPITVNIEVGWGNVGNLPIAPGAVSSSLNFNLITPSVTLTYAQLKTELMQHASSIDDVVAINNMPAIDPSWLIFGQPCSGRSLGASSG
jgi:hypothetical protein